MFAADMSASCNQEFFVSDWPLKLPFYSFFVVDVAFEVLLFYVCKNHDFLWIQYFYLKHDWKNKYAEVIIVTL